MTDSINSKKLSGIPSLRGSSQQGVTAMTSKLSRRAALAGAVAFSALAPPTNAAQSAAGDPVFAAIARHNAARALYWAGDEVSDDVLNSRGDANDHALAEVLTTRPTTAAGCVALLRHVDDYLNKYENGASILNDASDPVGAAGAGFLRLMADSLAEHSVVQS